MLLAHLQIVHYQDDAVAGTCWSCMTLRRTDDVEAHATTKTSTEMPTTWKTCSRLQRTRDLQTVLVIANCENRYSNIEVFG